MTDLEIANHTINLLRNEVFALTQRLKDAESQRDAARIAEGEAMLVVESAEFKLGLERTAREQAESQRDALREALENHRESMAAARDSLRSWGEYHDTHDKGWEREVVGNLNAVLKNGHPVLADTATVAQDFKDRIRSEARREALEEAAKIAHGDAYDWCERDGQEYPCMNGTEIGNRIRALASRPAGNPNEAASGEAVGPQVSTTRQTWAKSGSSQKPADGTDAEPKPQTGSSVGEGRE